MNFSLVQTFGEVMNVEKAKLNGSLLPLALPLFVVAAPTTSNLVVFFEWDENKFVKF